MVEYSLNHTLGAVADPTRRAILAQLSLGEARISDVAAEFPVSFNAVSKHIRVLEQAGLVARRRQGREFWLSLNAAPLADASAWIEHYRAFWEGKLDALERFLARRRKKS